MLFTISWTFDPKNRDAAIKRFLESGGAPPKGVKMLGRWHAVGGATGIAVAETSDPSLMQKWVLDWSDLMKMSVYSVLTDEQAAPLLAAAVGKK